jgi:hypothetical protein
MSPLEDGGVFASGQAGVGGGDGGTDEPLKNIFYIVNFVKDL